MQFNELNDKAKERARDWWRSIYEFDSEYVIDDAATVADLFGLDIRMKVVRRADKTAHYEPSVYWTGFYSQGDGASFSGVYSYRKGGLKAVKDYAPQDTTLHNIVQRLQRVQARNFYGIRATISREGHYYHQFTMRFDISHHDVRDIPPADEEEFVDCMRDFAVWIYHHLRDEYEYDMSDEAVDESIIANEYEFDEEGKQV